MKRRYIEKLDTELSVLGQGVLRFPMSEKGNIQEGAVHFLHTAMNRGINYYDTGFHYMGGKSEGLIHDALVCKYPRETFHIADKMPTWMQLSRDDMERIFLIQLERLGVKYIDFYLLHGLSKKKWLKAYDAGVISFLDEKRKEGKIRKVGFSYHDCAENLAEITDAYDWDFAQLQINYYDWTVWDADRQYRILEERGIPCITMETVMGGVLSQLPDQAESLYRSIRPDASIASWAIRFVASLPNVAVMLSGMTNIEQLEDNISSLEGNICLSEEEKNAISAVVGMMQEKQIIQCRGCGYCKEVCPRHIDIPNILRSYSDYKLLGGSSHFDLNEGLFRAGECVGCGSCVKLCPQNINIPEEMSRITSFCRSMIDEKGLGLNAELLKEEIAKGSQIVLFGAGTKGIELMNYLVRQGHMNIVFSDNDARLWNQSIDCYLVIPPSEICKRKNIRIIISSVDYRKEIEKQLVDMGLDHLIINR